MIVDGMILAFVIALFRGGSFKGFERLNILGGKWILTLFLIQLVLLLTSLQIPVLKSTAPYWVMMFYVLFIILGVRNRHLPGFNILLTGIILNLIVMLANGGRMPVSIEMASLVDMEMVQQLQTSAVKHSIMTKETLFWFLGDIIPLVPPYPTNKVVSIGDVLLNVGGFVFIWNTMMVVKRKKLTMNKGGEVL